MQKDIPTAQNQDQVDMYHYLIDTYQVTTFIELGTFMGGLTYEMMLKHPEMDIYSFEYDGSTIHPTVKSHPHVYALDVFDRVTVSIVSGAINNSTGTVLLFCDDGDKIKEFWLYYPLLRVGDFILVHDYPGEATPEFVEQVNKECLDLDPMDQDEYIRRGFVCWRKTNPVIE